jgi:glutathione synthase
MAQPLRVAVQMDPIAGLNPAGDSTLALMRSAQARGHSLSTYAPTDLDWIEGRAVARARPVAVRPGTPHWEWLGETAEIDLGTDVDVVLMRQDPPFDMAYITATHILEHAQRQGTRVVNDPASVRNAPEKLFVLDFAHLMPPTLVTRSLDAVRAFRERHGSIVVKPLFGNGGAAVFLLAEGDGNMAALVELFADRWVEPFMVQAFLPSVADGDKRIVLIDGEVAGAINRRPKAGEIRSNLAAGGAAEPTELSPRDREICDALGPELKRRGLVFTGIDVIGGHLTEINVTSPTGLVAIDRFAGTDTPARFWDAVERMGR